mmetsp:Transcript_56403/g.167879  ORF Transcript_56403/g.167879 Transcript_56403/m.167879 type:complete len:264 (-) Transcript_56403:169-960(-)
MISPSSTSEKSKCGTEPTLPRAMSRSLSLSESFCTSFSSLLDLRCSSRSCSLASLASSPSASPRWREGSVWLKRPLPESSRNHAGSGAPASVPAPAGAEAAAASSSPTRARSRSTSMSMAFCSLRQGAFASPSPESSWSMSTPSPAGGRCRWIGAGPQSSAAETSSAEAAVVARSAVRSAALAGAPPSPRAACRRSVLRTCAGVWPGVGGGFARPLMVDEATREATGLPSSRTERRRGRAWRSSSGRLSSPLLDRSSSSRSSS